jgi:hypothetical protein
VIGGTYLFFWFDWKLLLRKKILVGSCSATKENSITADCSYPFWVDWIIACKSNSLFVGM